MCSYRCSWIGVYTHISELSSFEVPRAPFLYTDMSGLLRANHSWPGHLVRHARNRAPHAVATGPQAVPQPDETQPEGDGAARFDDVTSGDSGPNSGSEKP